MRYMDYESSAVNSSAQVGGTQPVVIQGLAAPYSCTSQSEFLSVCTPLNGQDQYNAAQGSSQGGDCNSRTNLHLLAIVDDVSYFDSQVNVLKTKGVKVVTLPSMSDQANL